MGTPYLAEKAYEFLCSMVGWERQLGAVLSDME
jgi:hypothetical protein